MFDLVPTPSVPIRRTKSSLQFQLGKDRFLPLPLQGQHEEYLVELTGDEDLANAKAWPFRRKMLAAFVLGFDTLVASWGSSVYSAAVQPVALEFGVSEVVAILGLTLYICGFATGPLAWGPLSELYGMLFIEVVACLRHNF